MRKDDAAPARCDGKPREVGCPDNGRLGLGARLPAADGFGPVQRFIHDAADGAGATPALRTATKALIDLARRARSICAVRQRGTHVVVGQDVTGTDNHLRRVRRRNGSIWVLSLAYAECVCKEKITVCSCSNLRLRDQFLGNSW